MKVIYVTVRILLGDKKDGVVDYEDVINECNYSFIHDLIKDTEIINIEE